MLNSKTFSDILGEFQDGMTAAGPENIPYNSGWESVLDPVNMAQIIRNTQIYRFTTATPRPQAYKSAYKPTAANTPSLSREQERTPHSFNSEQMAAYEELLRWAPHLNKAFTRSELKSAYRQSMLKTHPDHGGRSESFHAAKKSYHILLALVK